MRLLVTIQFAEDKFRKLTFFKYQVLNDLEQKEKDNTALTYLKGRHYLC